MKNEIKIGTEFKSKANDLIVYVIVNITAKSIVFNKAGWKKPSKQLIRFFMQDVDKGLWIIL